MAPAAIDATIRAILLSEWDPIGVAGEPAAQDEYDTYVASVMKLLHSNAPAQTIAKHLLSIERDRMGLRGDVATAQRAAARLVALK